MRIKNNLVRTGEKRSFIRDSFVNYIYNSTPTELRFDWLFPFFISVVIFIISALIQSDPNKLLITITQVNNISITIIAILAGFNTASLAIVASTNRNIFKSNIDSKSNVNNQQDEKEVSAFGNLKEEIPSNKRGSRFKALTNLFINNNTSNDLHTTLTFFSYAVISQLSILVIGIVLTLILELKESISNLQIGIPDSIEVIFFTAAGTIWLTLVLHVIFISIRNVDMIYHFIIYKDEIDN